MRATDAETGATAWIDTTTPAYRRLYTRRFDQRTTETRELFHRAGADFLSIETTESYAQVLLRFFEQRAHTIMHG